MDRTEFERRVANLLYGAGFDGLHNLDKQIISCALTVAAEVAGRTAHHGEGENTVTGCCDETHIENIVNSLLALRSHAPPLAREKGEAKP